MTAPQGGTVTLSLHADASSTQNPYHHMDRSDNFREALLHEHAADQRESLAVGHQLDVFVLSSEERQSDQPIELENGSAHFLKKALTLTPIVNACS